MPSTSHARRFQPLRPFSFVFVFAIAMRAFSAKGNRDGCGRLFVGSRSPAMRP
jgi:hypothetical protein